MSNGDKKPGLRDIRSLRERLGRLNKDQSAPKDRATVPGTDPYTSGGSEDAATDVFEESQPTAAEPQEDLTQPVGSESISPSLDDSAAGGQESLGGVDFGVFSKPKPAAAPAKASRPAPQFEAASSGPTTDADNPFANPLQVGQYAEASRPVDLSAEEQAGLDDFERKQRGIRLPIAIGTTIVFTLVALLFGFLTGDVRNTRRAVNAQIDASIKLQKNVKNLLLSLDQLAPVVDALKPGQLDLDKIDAIPKDLPGIDAAILMSSPVPLHPELSGLLSNFLASLNTLFRDATQHRNITIGRDKAELESISKGSSFSQNTHYAVVYTPLDPKVSNVEYVPPIGRIVAITGKPELNEKKDNRFVPTVDRKGIEKKFPIKSVLRINKDQFIASGKANAMTLFVQRTQALKAALKKVREVEGPFRKTLKDQAQRAKVFSF
ncbi:MAG: hypothetical protein VX589_02545 [Myxococcota bacterium]|nr:hypothetical protein [Myxococcota bacterium]